MIRIDKGQLENMKLYLPYLVILALCYVVIQMDARIAQKEEQARKELEVQRDFWKDAFIRTNNAYQEINKYENATNLSTPIHRPDTSSGSR